MCTLRKLLYRVFQFPFFIYITPSRSLFFISLSLTRDRDGDGMSAFLICASYLVPGFKYSGIVWDRLRFVIWVFNMDMVPLCLPIVCTRALFSFIFYLYDFVWDCGILTWSVYHQWFRWLGYMFSSQFYARMLYTMFILYKCRPLIEIPHSCLGYLEYF